MANSNVFEYAPGIPGKFLFRVRETHIRDHIAQLIAKGASGAAKLDLALRGIALDPRHLGKRTTVGLVLPKHTYGRLHDLVRPADHYGLNPDTPEVARLKRKWVSEQLAKLEAMGLIEREARPGKRPRIIVLKDDASGDSFDDPDGKGQDSYVTVLGGVVASSAFAEWGGPETAAYLVSMIAERYEIEHRRRRLGKDYEAPDPGSGEWWRPLSWFADKDGYRPTHHVIVPFSIPTLERGMRRLLAEGLVSRKHITKNPLTKRRIESGRRNLYTNHFHTLTEEKFTDEQLQAFVEESASKQTAKPGRSGRSKKLKRR